MRVKLENFQGVCTPHLAKAQADALSELEKKLALDAAACEVIYACATLDNEEGRRGYLATTMGNLQKDRGASLQECVLGNRVLVYAAQEAAPANADAPKEAAGEKRTQGKAPRRKKPDKKLKLGDD